MTAEEVPQESGETHFDRMSRSAQDASERLGLPRDFLVDVIDEDDWSCVLKLHSLIDASLERVIREKCFAKSFSIYARDENLVGKITSSLSFEGRAGKISLVQAYHLLARDLLAFAKGLNRVRNAYAHDLKHVGRSVRETAQALDPQGNLEKQLFEGFPMAPDVQSKAWRLVLIMKTMATLWQLEVRTLPPPGLLGRSKDWDRLLGTRT